MGDKNSLELAEYISLGCSCTGLVAAAFSQQVAFAAIPLMISLPIGFTTRMRLERQIKELSNKILPAERVIRDRNIERITLAELQITELFSQFNCHQEIRECANLGPLIEDTNTYIQEIDTRTVSFPQDLVSLQRSYQAFADSDREVSTLTANLSELRQQVADVRHQLVELEREPLEFKNNFDIFIEDFSKIITKDLQKSYSYDLVIDRPGSRQILLESLQQAEDRIVIVCPWISGHVIREIKPHIEAALERQVTISIGWGHLNDTRSYRNKNIESQARIDRDTLLRLNHQDWKYGGIKILEKLQFKYPQRLTLKVLGTHEKFLVCDNRVAMIGSHNLLTSGESSPERELGLKTNDTHIIDRLIARFEQASVSETHTYSSLN